MTETETKVVAVDEFYELDVGEDLENSPRYNEDIAPTKIAERT